MPSDDDLDRTSDGHGTSADEDPAEAWVGDARRRKRLLLCGAGLLVLGAAVNIDRLVLARVGDDGTSWSLDDPSTETRFTGHMRQPDRETKSEPSGQRHFGAEGRMGKPTAKNKSGLYAMKGPETAYPVAGRVAYEVAATATPAAPATVNAERYAHVASGDFVASASDPLSTFSIDVDTASYSNVRRHLLREHVRPPVDAVRTEELVNYFAYDDPAPTGDAPFSVTSEVGSCPWAPDHRLVRIGLRGAALETTPARNLVFLVDVSGSMAEELPLVQGALGALVDRLDRRDRVAIVVYAGETRVVLDATSGADKALIRDAVYQMRAGGGTNGESGILEAYRLARESFVEGGVNRVVLATDGDFNVGVSSVSQLVEIIERERTSGVFLSVLGFGSGDLNDELMERLADRGNGNYAYIDGAAEAKKVLVREADSTLVTIAKDVKVQLEFDPARVASHRLVGYENRVLAHEEFADDRIDAGEIGAGHTVTALYEIEPVADADGPLAEVRVRWKAPDGDESDALAVELRDLGTALADTSRDLRFAAAVALFGQKLRGVPAVAESTFADVYALAEGALGPDFHCERREFLHMAYAAGMIAREHMPKPVELAKSCEGPAMPRFEPMQNAVPYDWAPVRTFALEVLRLLPPLLALPLFVLAFVRRTTRRRGSASLTSRR